jgi:methylated-DNA-protein-cysteine methyltransferase related protein
MAAAIAPITIKTYPSQNAANCYLYCNMSKAKAKKAAQEQPRDKATAYRFFDDVYELVRQVPKGRVTSYGAIAAYLGTKLSARMVGWAMNAAGSAKPKVPAQRVVNRNGLLTGKHHFATPTLMEELLKKDGVKVENDAVVDFKKRFWDPAKELL